MADELQDLDKSHIWDLVDLPPCKSVVGCKRVHNIKTQTYDIVNCYKAQIVAKGFTQEYKPNYEGTFTPVVCFTSVHSFLAIVSIKHWSLFQMNITNTFLNSDLTWKFL